MHRVTPVLRLRHTPGGLFFRYHLRRDPIDEEKLIEDNLEEFGLLGLRFATWQERKRWLKERAGYGGLLSVPSPPWRYPLVPAPWMPHPKGISDITRVVFPRAHAVIMFEPF